jgi:DNA-directed RNA polymerase subunit RPC12/RpoP
MSTITDLWFDITKYAGIGFISLAVLNQLSYAIQLMSKPQRADKYKYASSKEVKTLKKSSTFLSIGIFFLAFNLVAGWLGLTESYQYIFVVFISFMISFVFGYGLSAYIQYYYPFILEKRLKNIRFKKLVSNRGKVMRLLNELEEDEHLTEEMVAMEDSMEADFDVWIDDTTGDKIIQRYDITEHALVCPNCNFRTLKERGDEITRDATEQEDGLLERNYKCTYCSFHETKEVRIPSWSETRDLEKV